MLRTALPLAATIASVAACSYDWERFDPRLGPATGGTGGIGGGGGSGAAAAGGTGGSGGSGGGGGAGGQGFPGYCRAITVTALSAAVPTGYSVRVPFDHASLVAAGKSQPDGSDVRVRWDDNGAWQSLHRAPSLESAWNGSATAVWFSTQELIDAQQADASYALCYGASEPGPLLDDPRQVFLFWDDFESGALGQWTEVIPSNFSVATDQARSGSHALKASEVDTEHRWIVANGIDEADLVLESFWYISVLAGMDLTQAVRASGTLPMDEYEGNLDHYGTQNWIISKQIADVWSSIQGLPGDVPVAAWTRVTVVMVGTQMKLLVGGTQVVPSSGLVDVGTELTSGTIGFRPWNVPAGEAWWVDDVRARRYVEPEPIVALASEQPAR